MPIRAVLAAMAVAAWSVSPRDVHAQVVHTPNDHIPNFAVTPTIRSAASGSWSAAATWAPSRLPAGSDVVSITHAVTYDSTVGDARVIGVDAGGALRFATDRTTRLRVGTLMVLPGGVLEIGAPSVPVDSSVIAEVLFKDIPLSAAADPDQYGTGLLAIDGTVTIHGAARSPAFVRTAVEPRAGHGTLSLAAPVSGWRAGDRIFLPDTRQVPADRWFDPAYPLQIEERIVQAVSPDGLTIALTSPLAFDHRGARDADGTPTIVNGSIRLLPHVGNLTRNVVLRSENPAGTRAHTLYTHRSSVSIHHAQFQDLGRTRAVPLDPTTNHIGRYPLHLHHLIGPINPANTGYQFQIVGNAINDSLKWPMAVHGSHFGLVKQNVVFGGPEQRQLEPILRLAESTRRTATVVLTRRRLRPVLTAHLAPVFDAVAHRVNSRACRQCPISLASFRRGVAETATPWLCLRRSFNTNCARWRAGFSQPSGVTGGGSRRSSCRSRTCACSTGGTSTGRTGRISSRPPRG